MNLKTILIIVLIFLLIIGICYIIYRRIHQRILIQKFTDNKNQLSTIISKNLKNKIDIPIYYINLDRSPDRKEFMESQFKKYRITNYNRISGIDGKNLKNTYKDTIDGITFTNNYKENFKNVIACLLSHIKAIKTAYENGLEQVLILEDDCSLDLMYFWPDTLKNIINKYNTPDWDIYQLYTGNCLDFNLSGSTLFEKSKTGNCFGAVAYLINKKGMQKVLDFIKSDNNEIILGRIINNQIFPSDLPSDIFLYEIVNTYILHIPLFFTNNYNMSSTINNGDYSDTFAIESSNKIINYYLHKV